MKHQLLAHFPQLQNKPLLTSGLTRILVDKGVQEHKVPNDRVASGTLDLVSITSVLFSSMSKWRL